jgi:hypothetical protein
MKANQTWDTNLAILEDFQVKGSIDGDIVHNLLMHNPGIYMPAASKFL